MACVVVTKGYNAALFMFHARHRLNQLNARHQANLAGALDPVFPNQIATGNIDAEHADVTPLSLAVRGILFA